MITGVSAFARSGEQAVEAFVVAGSSRMPKQEGGGKLPGKAEWSGRRRPTTRRSGFKAHEDTSGGEFKVLKIPTVPIGPGAPVVVSFLLPSHSVESLLAFGGWFACDVPVQVIVADGPSSQTLTAYPWPSWNKVGSMWSAGDGPQDAVRVTFTATRTGRIALHEFACGIVNHRHLDDARDVLLRNMYQFSPEAHFFSTPGKVSQTVGGRAATSDGTRVVELIIKSCNRCARFLPVNIPHERNHLSFSNHCVADHRRPCRHNGFGVLRNVDTDEQLELDYGFQLECRFCKKFEVNAAHNPKRTTAQMKEDAARRRGFELLIEALSGGTPQLRYRHETGRELADDVLARSKGRCFNCKKPFEKGRGWHLDHTRPLALLWPLDGTATALCGDCNSEKRDRAPVDFYAEDRLEELAKMTGIPLSELRNPQPNMTVIDALLKRLDWFFDKFLTTADMTREHDGKIAGELVVKALQKVLERCRGGAPVDLVADFNRRRRAR